MHPARTLFQCAGEGRMRWSLPLSKSLSQHECAVWVLPTMDGSSSFPKLSTVKGGRLPLTAAFPPIGQAGGRTMGPNSTLASYGTVVRCGGPFAVMRREIEQRLSLLDLGTSQGAQSTTGKSSLGCCSSLSHRRAFAEARAAARKYLALEPGFTVGHLVETGPYRRTPNQEPLFAAMRQAGLPE